MFVRLFVCLSALVCSFVRLPACSSAYLSERLSVHLSIHLSIYSSINLYISVYSSVLLSTCPFVHSSVCRYLFFRVFHFRLSQPDSVFLSGNADGHLDRCKRSERSFNIATIIMTIILK
jgi:hypothetical protein